MKKLLLTMLFALCSFTATFAEAPECPAYLETLTTTEKTIVETGNRNGYNEPLLFLTITMDGEKVSFQANSAHTEGNMIYLIGTGDNNVRSVAVSQDAKTIKLITLAPRAYRIDNVNLNSALMDEIRNLPDANQR